MVSERDSAKRSIKGRQADDPELETVISEGEDLKLQLAQETNRHKETMRDKELGQIGQWIGGKESAPFNIAVCILACGVLVGMASLILAAIDTTGRPFWGQQVERGFTFAAAAGAFIAGRGRR